MLTTCPCLISVRLTLLFIISPRAPSTRRTTLNPMNRHRRRILLLSTYPLHFSIVNHKLVFPSFTHPDSTPNQSFILILPNLLFSPNLLIFIPFPGSIFNKTIDNPILSCVHDQGKNKHDKCNLQPLVALCPAKSPISNPTKPRKQLKEQEDAKFHEDEADAVDKKLLGPPAEVGRATVVAGGKGSRRVGEGCMEE